MEGLNDISFQNCLLCLWSFNVDDPYQSKINDKSPQKILAELLDLWTFTDLTDTQLDTLKNYFTKNGPICRSCRIRIDDYEVELQKVRTLVSEFEKQFKAVSKFLDSNAVPLTTEETSQVRKRNRQKVKSKALPVSSETEADKAPRPPEDNFVERGSCFVDVSLQTFERLKTSSETERGDIVAVLLKDILPKCSFRIGGLEAVCKVKSCGLKLRISLNEGDQSNNPLLHLSLSGESNHCDNEDADRRTFELTKLEFFEEKICEFCCRKFDDDQEWSRQRQKAETEFICPKCDQKFKTFQLRNSHYLVQHTSDAPYKCDKCSKTFKTAGKSSEHQKACFDGTRFSCNLCQKTFSSVRNLDNHVQVVHLKTNSKWSYKCNKCSKSFYKSDNLKTHMLTHVKEKKFVCNVEGCGLRFKRQKALNVHLTRLHGDAKECHLCSYCGKNFASQSGIKLHMAKHTGKEYVKRKMVCGTCGKAFRCKADLETHSVVHSKEKPHSCHLCNTSFTQKSSLKDHLNVHLNTFQCQKCKKSFGRQRYLDLHDKTCGNVDNDADVTHADTKQLLHNVVDQTLIAVDPSTSSIIATSTDVQCVIIGNDKLQLIPSGDGSFVVSDGADIVRGTNVLAHFNESGNIAMLEYTDQS